MRRLLLLFLLLAAPARAEDLKFATWNLDWLTDRPAGAPGLPSDVTPKTAADIDRLRSYAEETNADVVALEEVDGPAIAARIFPPDRYVLHFTRDRVVQRVGIAIRKDIPFTANPDLSALDIYEADAPQHLRSGADVTLRLPGGFLRVLAVHLKTGCQRDRLTSTRPACAVLNGQLPVLQGWIAQRAHEGVPFVIMGDFNRRMSPTDPFFAALNASSPLVRATEGRANPCWGGEDFIDHILAGGAARGWMQPASLRVLVYREHDAAWKDRLSDHCPVSVHFTLPDTGGSTPRVSHAEMRATERGGHQMSVQYTAIATTVGGRNGHTESADGVMKFDLSIPKEMGGPGKPGTANPEEFFACGYSACFGSAIDHVARMDHVKIGEISVTAEITISQAPEGGFFLAAVLKIALPGLDRATAETLVVKAHEICPYSNATRGNMKVNLVVL